MTEYTIELPDELLQIITDEGYTPSSYIQTMLLNPLLARLKRNQEKSYLSTVRKSINNKVNQAQQKVKIKQVPQVVETEITK